MYLVSGDADDGVEVIEEAVDGVSSMIIISSESSFVFFGIWR